MTCLSAGNLKCFAAKLKMLTICTAKTLVLKAIKSVKYCMKYLLFWLNSFGKRKLVYKTNCCTVVGLGSSCMEYYCIAKSWYFILQTKQ